MWKQVSTVALVPLILSGFWVPLPWPTHRGLLSLPPAEAAGKTQDVPDQTLPEVMSNRIALLTAEVLHGRLIHQARKHGMAVGYSGGLSYINKRRGIQMRDFSPYGFGSWCIWNPRDKMVLFYMMAGTVKRKDAVVDLEVNGQTLYLRILFVNTPDLKTKMGPPINCTITEFLQQLKQTRLEEEGILAGSGQPDHSPSLPRWPAGGVSTKQPAPAQDLSAVAHNRISLITAELLHGRLNSLGRQCDLESAYEGGLRVYYDGTSLRYLRSGRKVQPRRSLLSESAKWSLRTPEAEIPLFAIVATTKKPKDEVIQLDIKEQRLYLVVLPGEVRDLGTKIPSVNASVQGLLQQLKNTRLEEEK